jgi:hypothetical protein
MISHGEKMKFMLITYLFVGLLVGCSAASSRATVATQPQEMASAPATSLTPQASEIVKPPLTQPADTTLTSSMELLIEKARQDLAQKLGVAVDGITVGAVIGQEFSTNAFYCRKSTERIARDDTPAAISGVSILLSASGQRYEYHANDMMVIFCWPL